MWKSAVGHNVAMKVESEGDDWETDADFEVGRTSLKARQGVVAPVCKQMHPSISCHSRSAATVTFLVPAIMCEYTKS